MKGFSKKYSCRICQQPVRGYHKRKYYSFSCRNNSPEWRKGAAPAELLDSMQNSFVRFEGRPISIVEYYPTAELTPALDRIAGPFTRKVATKGRQAVIA
jgi:hypothetical protein